MSKPNSKALTRKAIGVFLLVVTVGLATCQSVVNSFAAAEAGAAADGGGRD